MITVGDAELEDEGDGSLPVGDGEDILLVEVVLCDRSSLGTYKQVLLVEQRRPTSKKDIWFDLNCFSTTPSRSNCLYMGRVGRTCMS